MSRYSDYIDAVVDCPFFRRVLREPPEIQCEAPGKGFMRHGFKRLEDLREHARSVCRDKYSECPVYEVMIRHYERVGG